MRKNNANKRGLEPAASDSPLAAKKSLGQHFLTDKKYLHAVADAAGLPKVGPWEASLIVEIGPGKGSLTAELLARGARVVAIEKDQRLIPLLQEKFSSEISSGQLRVIESDALRFDPHTLYPIPYSVVGNIPYYITGALIQKFLTEKNQPARIVFLVQKEVAERIAPSTSLRTGRSNKESLLSLSVKCYGSPRYVCTVPKEIFAPPPKVDSAILSIENISRDHFADAAHERRFFALIRGGFAHKRKLLVRNLESAELFKQNTPQGALERANIAPNARAEDVPLEKWLALAAS